MDCKPCKGNGTVYGPYRGIAGCETEEFECEECKGSGTRPCDNCGKPSRAKDQYCCDACAIECGDEP
jgi:hypothetical protein